jgi:hypothetical protein
MLNWLKTYWPVVVIVVAMLAVIDGTVSSLLTCHPISNQTGGGANQQETKEYCTALSGPLLTTIRWIADLSHKYEGLITAAFTVVLAVFTGRLWFSTDKLWEATKKLAIDAENTAQNQAADTRILQRAYIRVDPAGIGPSRGESKCHPNIIIKNAGNLPARHVRWCITWIVDKNDRRSDLPIEHLTVEGDNTMPPKAKMLQGGPIIYLGDGPNELRNERGLYLYIWGAVFFEDGFGKDRTTRFCHRYNTVNLDKAYDKGGVLRGRKIDASEARFNRHGNEAD